MLVSKGISTCLLKFFSTMCILGLFTFDAAADNGCFGASQPTSDCCYGLTFEGYSSASLFHRIQGSGPTGKLYKTFEDCKDTKNEVTFGTETGIVPTKLGYKFVGYYLNLSSTSYISQNSSSSSGLLINVDGKLRSGAGQPPTKDTYVYAAWAKDCENTYCSVSIGESGTVTYTAKCKTGGEVVEGVGTVQKPVCKTQLDLNDGTGDKQDIYVCGEKDIGRFCTTSDCAPNKCLTYGANTGVTMVPTRAEHDFRGYYVSDTSTQVINKDGKQVKNVNDVDNWKFYAKWVENPCREGKYYDKDSDDCHECESQEKGGETYYFTSINGPHDQPKEDVCYVDNNYVDNNEELYTYKDTIGRYILDDGFGGNCTLGQFNGN